MHFQTDRSGNTWHRDTGRGNNIEGVCGVTVAGTQSYRQAARVPAGGRACPRCRRG